MSKNNFLLISILTIPILVSGCSRPVKFQNEILPILQDSCVSCHSTEGEGIKDAGLDLTNYESLMAGTNFGPIVSPGSAISSTLYLVIAHKVDSKIQMPPHHHDKFPMGEGEPLTLAQIELIESWIDEGALNN